MVKKNVPTSLTIVSILYYISAVVLVLAAIGAIIGGAFLSGLLGLGVLGATIGFVLFIPFLGFAVLAFFIARGLPKAQNWARIVAIIFVILGILGGLSALFRGSLESIANLLIQGFIGYTLLLNDKVKKFF